MHARPRFLLPQPPPLGPLAAYSSPRFAACTQDDVGARPSAGTALLLLSLCSLVGTVLIGIAGSSRSTRCRLQAVRGEAQLREQVVEQQARRQHARGSEAARWQRRRDVDMSAAQGARHDEALYALGLHEACPRCGGGKGGAARRGWWAVLRPPFRVSRVVSCVA